jgi:hypothetical protein
VGQTVWSWVEWVVWLTYGIDRNRVHKNIRMRISKRGGGLEGICD